MTTLLKICVAINRNRHQHACRGGGFKTWSDGNEGRPVHLLLLLQKRLCTPFEQIPACGGPLLAARLGGIFPLPPGRVSLFKQTADEGIFIRTRDWGEFGVYIHSFTQNSSRYTVPYGPRSYNAALQAWTVCDISLSSSPSEIRGGISVGTGRETRS